MKHFDSLFCNCPHCNKKYYFTEIFYPETIIGDIKDIVINKSGEIISYTGDYPTLSEEYICDECNKKFKATFNFNIVTESVDEDEFDEETTIII